MQYYSDSEDRVWTKEELQRELKLITIEAGIVQLLDAHDCVLEECDIEADDGYIESDLFHVHNNCFGINRPTYGFLVWLKVFVTYRLDNDFNEEYIRAKQMSGVLEVAMKQLQQGKLKEVQRRPSSSSESGVPAQPPSNKKPSYRSTIGQKRAMSHVSQVVHGAVEASNDENSFEGENPMSLIEN